MIPSGATLRTVPSTAGRCHASSARTAPQVEIAAATQDSSQRTSQQNGSPAQTFVQQNEGVIEFESRPGRTDFRILLPLS